MKQLDNKKQAHIKFSDELNEKLLNYCKKVGATKSAVVNIAVDQFLKEVDPNA